MRVTVPAAGLYYVAVTITASLPALHGCSAPPGRGHGRVPVSETTPAEAHSPQMLTADLAAASDRVARALAADINRLVAEDWGGYRVTIVFGDIANRSGTMPTSDFEYVRERIKNKLMHSQLVRDNVKFTAGRPRITQLNRREYGVAADPLQQGGGEIVPYESGNPAYTFYLNGNVYGVHRQNTHLYYVTFKLHRAVDGEEVFSQDYEVKYRR